MSIRRRKPFDADILDRSQRLRLRADTAVEETRQQRVQSWLRRTSCGQTAIDEHTEAKLRRALAWPRV